MIKKWIFESGIYNYCDRWCEKCQKTEKCFLFHEEQKERKKLISDGIDPDDPKNISLIVERSFKKTEDMLNKLIKKHKIDLSKLDENQEEYERIEKDTKKDELYKLSHKFIKILTGYFKTTPSLDIIEYQECFEKLSHHGFFLGLKIYRFVSGIYQSSYERGADRKFSLEDSEKCAMIAYRSALISKESLGLMGTYVTDHRIDDLIQILDKIIKEIDMFLKKRCQNTVAT